MNKKTAAKIFKSEYADTIKTLSKTDRRCLWNDYVESLRRNSDITEKQAYTWTNIFK